MEDFEDNKNEEIELSKAEIFAQKILKFFSDLPKIIWIFIKKLPKNSWFFFKSQYRNTVFHFGVVLILLSILNINLFLKIEDLNTNIRYIDSNIYRLQTQVDDLEKKIEAIEERLTKVERVAHRHDWY